MAAAKKKATRTKAKAKAAPEPEVEEEDELEELELEELDEDEEEEAPASKSKAKKKATKKVEKDTWGTRELAEYIADEIGNEYSTKELRVLLRKMAKDGQLEWEVSQGSGSRYEWSGPTDPEVKAILKRVKSGEIEEARKEALDKLKEQQAAKRKNAPKKTTKKGKKKAEPEVEELEDDEELEELEDDEDEDDD